MRFEREAGLIAGEDDCIARTGGEEFAIVVPETNYEQALDVARKLRFAAANTAFAVQGERLEITASFGMCGLESIPLGVRKIAENLVRVADAALYRSKNTARNRGDCDSLSDRRQLEEAARAHD